MISYKRTKPLFLPVDPLGSKHRSQFDRWRFKAPCIDSFFTRIDVSPHPIP